MKDLFRRRGGWRRVKGFPRGRGRRVKGSLRGWGDVEGISLSEGILEGVCRREREVSEGNSPSAMFPDGATVFHPLPLGEGRGEGLGEGLGEG